MAISDRPILQRAFLEKTVADLHPRVAHCLPLVASMKDVLQSFATSHSGSVLALNDQGVLQGIVTERDIILKYSESATPDSVALSDLMSSPVQSLKARSSVARLLYVMANGGFRHVPIVSTKPSSTMEIISARDVIGFLYDKVVKRMSLLQGQSDVDEVIMENFFAADINVLQPLKVYWLDEKARVSEALNLFRSYKVDNVILGTNQNRVTGIFTERDLVSRVITPALPLKGTPLKTVMTPDPAMLTSQHKISDVFELLCARGFRHIPVLAADGMLVGTLNIKHLVKALTENILEELQRSSS